MSIQIPQEELNISEYKMREKATTVNASCSTIQATQLFTYSSLFRILFLK
jgi:hypothetical protein